MKKCTKCNLNYENDEKFCKSCGTPLTENNSILLSISSKTSVFLMLIIAWLAFINVIWLFFNKIIVPHFVETYNTKALNTIAHYTNLFIALISLSIIGVSFFMIIEKRIKIFIGICFLIMLTVFIIINMDFILK